MYKQGLERQLESNLRITITKYGYGPLPLIDLKKKEINALSANLRGLLAAT